MLYFCEQCEKIVPEKEVQDYTVKSEIWLQVLKEHNPHAAKFHEEQGFTLQPNLWHIYKRTVNYYKNQRPGTIGCCLEEETVHCGKVREPTDYEYFIHHTCKK